jgi:hypothetical protein
VLTPAAHCRIAGVAQLAEQRFRKPQVVGSSPTSGSKVSTRISRVFAVQRTCRAVSQAVPGSVRRCVHDKAWSTSRLQRCNYQAGLR